MNRDYPLAWRFTYANLPTGGTATIKVRLREWSSAERTAWTNGAMTTNTGHYTELTRTVTPRGRCLPALFRLARAGWRPWSRRDGPSASSIPGSLRRGSTMPGALALFTIKLNSTENGGDPANGTVLSPEDIDLSPPVELPANENTITFTMPNVYNGSPDWLHGFEIVGAASRLSDAARDAQGEDAGRTAAVDHHHRAAGTGQRRQAVRHHPAGRAGLGAGDESVAAHDAHPPVDGHQRRRDRASSSPRRRATRARWRRRAPATSAARSTGTIPGAT